ncbi:MAG TPA: VTT domain-containing protein [Candidatus Kapabacteria bacterium]|nr:VTT domain-containing protein [Candidatus Kapabacteria bacterium]
MHAITDLFHTLSSPVGLEHLVSEGGMLMLAIIIFAENGVLAGFFLPGDSLLITAGILIGGHRVTIEFLPLAIVLTLSAIMGETVGYYIGKAAGQKLYQRPNSRLFKREHLERAHKFYEKHGGQTIILARFIPIIRTFVPVVAGAAGMDAKKFTMFNIMGGVLWVCGVMLLGLLLGASVKNIGDYIYLIIATVIVLSMLPPVIEFFRNRARRLRIRAGAQEE